MSKTSSWWRNRKWMSVVCKIGMFSWSLLQEPSWGQDSFLEPVVLFDRSFYYFSLYADWRLHVLDVMRAIGEMLIWTLINTPLSTLSPSVVLPAIFRWSYWASLVFLGNGRDWLFSNYVQLCFQIGQPGRFKLFSALKLCKLDRCSCYGECWILAWNDQDCHLTLALI